MITQRTVIEVQSARPVIQHIDRTGAQEIVHLAVVIDGAIPEINGIELQGSFNAIREFVADLGLIVREHENEYRETLAEENVSGVAL